MEQNEQHGVLVGWSSQEFGSNIMIDLQTFQRSSWNSKKKPDHMRIFMTRSQAAVLANHLLKVSGSPPPSRRKNWLAAWLS